MNGDIVRQKIEDALSMYIAELCESADQTHCAQDRPQYEKHLAAAARMFGAIRRDPTLNELRSIIAGERRSYGWSYLSNSNGQRAEAAFNSFAKCVVQGHLSGQTCKDRLPVG